MHIARWFTFIFVEHKMSPGFHDSYYKMVYFDSHRPYTVAWNILSICKMVYFDSHRQYNVSRIP